MSDVERVADLLRQRNAIDADIAAITGRPMAAGHLGEWIAQQILGVQLERSAVTRAIDGRFTTFGPANATVNVKWYLKQEGMLDLVGENGPDYYLVFAGPHGGAVSSHGTTRPWCIAAVFLFAGATLVTDLTDRKRKIGVASSVRSVLWQEAEIYPREHPDYPLTARQRQLLALFAAQN